jgi:hypothetical protein
MRTFEEILDEKRQELNEGVSDKAKKFMIELNKSLSLLKDDIKQSDSNQDWYVRLESIKIMIEKTLKDRN